MVGGLANCLIGIAVNVISAWRAPGGGMFWRDFSISFSFSFFYFTVVHPVLIAGFQMIGLVIAALLPLTFLATFLLNLMAKYTFQISEAYGYALMMNLIRF
jgi:hypothetical protein